MPLLDTPSPVRASPASPTRRYRDVTGFPRSDSFASILAGAAWTLSAALVWSASHAPDERLACEPDAFWASGWFFAPPLIALVAIAVSRRIGTVAVVGSSLLLAGWLFAGVPFWLLAAIAHGANCHGG